MNSRIFEEKTSLITLEEPIHSEEENTEYCENWQLCNSAK